MVGDGRGRSGMPNTKKPFRRMDARTNEMKACSDYGQYLLNRDRYTVQDLELQLVRGMTLPSTWYNDGLVYSSSRDSAKAISREHTWTGTQFFMICGG